jgi:aromatic ring-cleaving dioxygenase
MQNNNEDRILTYVTGLLYFYGVMCFDDLYEAVSEQIAERFDEDDFRVMLEKAVSTDEGPYVFEMQGDCYFDIEVEDVEWVLEEQAKRDEIGFRPVTEEEARHVIEDKYPLLWNKEEKDFFRWLLEFCDNDAQLAAPLFLDYEARIRNNEQPLELSQKILYDLLITETEDVRKVAAMVVELYKNVPMWTLKGWSPADVLYL